MIDVLEHSNHMRNTARHILQQSQIIETLSKHCTPQLTGSYALDLMFDPDIDIVVTTEYPKDVSRRVFNDVLDQDFFQRYEYGDFVRFQRHNRPAGYIIVLAITIDAIYWEIEIWFVYERPPHEIEAMTYVQKHLVPEAKAVILNAKYQRYVHGKDKSNISSVDIYYGILRDHAYTLDEIKERLNKEQQ